MLRKGMFNMFTLITGGSGSGKSEFAEDLATSYPNQNRIYIATMYPYDEECQRKINRHIDMRKLKNFHTLECYYGLKDRIIPPNATVLLDCLSNLVANERYMNEESKDFLVKNIIDGVKNIIAVSKHVILVTNEIFSDGVEYDMETIQYLKDLGTLNCSLAAIADEVIEVVYSIPIYHKKHRI